MKSWSLSVLKRVFKLVYAFPTTQFATVMPVGRRPTWRSKLVAISGVMSSSIGVKSLAATLVMICPRVGLSTRVRFPTAGDSVSGRGEARLLLECVSSLERSSRSLLTRSYAIRTSLVVGMYLVGAIDSSPAYRIGSPRVSPEYLWVCWIGVNPPWNESPTSPDVAFRVDVSKTDCVISFPSARVSKYM